MIFLIHWGLSFLVVVVFTVLRVIILQTRRRQLVFLLTKRLILLKQTLLIISTYEIQAKPLIDSIIECSHNFDLMKCRMEPVCL